MTQRVATIVSLAVAGFCLVNMMCAAIFGAILTNYSSEWVYLRNEPVGFWWGLLVSLIGFVGLSALGAIMIFSARHERRHWRKVSSLAPMEDRLEAPDNPPR